MLIKGTGKVAAENPSKEKAEKSCSKPSAGLKS